MQASLPDYARSDIAVYAISYDPVDVLASFTERYDVTYPLLADEGSETIRAFGLLNEHLETQQAYYGIKTRPHMLGVPYPGSFVLDEAGVIREKVFEQSYRVRPTAVDFLTSSFNDESRQAGVRDHVETDEIQVTAWLGRSIYRPYQKLQIHLGIQVRPGLHIYGLPIPKGYVPLTVEVDARDGLEVEKLWLPEPAPYEVLGLDERFYVYEGEIRAELPLILTQNIGDVTLNLSLKYQACTDRECFPPAEVELHLPLEAQDNVRD